MSVRDKVTLITGATGGLGTVVSAEFHRAGARVALVGSKESSVKELQKKLAGQSGSSFTAVADLTNEESVKELIETVVQKFGRVDILLNLAGGFLGGASVAETSLAQFQQMIDINLKTVFLSCKHTIPVMQRQNSGKIINIGSKGGISGTSGMSAYSCAKAGVINLTQTLAREGQANSITANVIIPSTIDTEENRTAMPDADFSSWVAPYKLAKIILFLCSEDAEDISGAILPVYGRA